jgi:hypothetical protein
MNQGIGSKFMPALGNGPLFSVVIPTFNRAELIEQTLKSVFAQRFTSYEVIVVDDGSTDATLQLLLPFQPGLTVLTQPNRGPAAARNLGADRAHGDYLAFLDSDDVWFPWTLEIYACVLRQARHPAFLAGRPLWFSSCADLGGVGESDSDWLGFRDYLSSGDQWRGFGASSFVISRKRFSDIGGFNSKFRAGEDPDLCLRLGTESGFVQVVAPATFGYRKHHGHISSGVKYAIEGAQNLIHAEYNGEYPGGLERRRERWRILARHVRPVVVAALRARMISTGIELYSKSFLWQITTGAWRFLFGCPFLAAFYTIAPTQSRRRE